MRFAFLVPALLPFLLAPRAAVAETAYVTDNLRLGLHQAEDTSDRAFRTLESGQELEILSRDRNYANVRLPDGIEGYVKAAYLVFEKPAKLIVAETQAENERLQREIEEVKSAFAQPAARIDALEAALEESRRAAEEAESRASELMAQIDGYQGRQDQFKYSMPLKWVFGALFVCLLAGFLSALWWADYRSRKRHGGIRIY